MKNPAGSYNQLLTADGDLLFFDSISFLDAQNSHWNLKVRYGWDVAEPPNSGWERRPELLFSGTFHRTGEEGRKLRVENRVGRGHTCLFCSTLLFPPSGIGFPPVDRSYLSVCEVPFRDDSWLISDAISRQRELYQERFG